jgi:nucleoside-diphosphate-sugar epimerase
MVAKETGFTGKISWDETKPTGAHRRILDGKLAKKVLGWEPETPLQVGLKATVQWYREDSQHPRSGQEKD